MDRFYYKSANFREVLESPTIFESTATVQQHNINLFAMLVIDGLTVTRWPLFFNMAGLLQIETEY